MDKNKRMILDLLLQNSRYTNDELASMVNLNVDDVIKHIDEMKSAGIICQFTTVINENLIQTSSIKALVELSIRPEKDTGYDSIAKKVYCFPNVKSHFLVSGKYDFLVVVEGKDHKDIAHFVFDKLATIENVKSTTTHFIFKSYKENGVLMEAENSVNRLPILP